MLKIGNQDGELVLVQFDIGGVTIFSLMSPVTKEANYHPSTHCMQTSMMQASI